MTSTAVPVYGLYSGVAEWTDSIWTAYPSAPDVPLPPSLKELNRQSRIVRGGPMSVVEGNPNPTEYAAGPAQRLSLDVEKIYGGLGFRCGAKHHAAICGRTGWPVEVTGQIGRRPECVQSFKTVIRSGVP